MSKRKRGAYFSYLHCNEDSASVKIPRQTQWNRQNKFGHSSVEKFIDHTTNVSNVYNDLEIDDTVSEISCDSNVDYLNDENVDEQFHDFEQSEEYFTESNVRLEDLRTLHPNTTCTVNDVHCMIYAYVIRHGLTWIATEDLIQLINRVIGRDELVPSKYTFKKKIKQISSCKSVKHFTCHQCDLYLGSEEDIMRSNTEFCSNCETKIQLDTKYNKNHFITIPFKGHLQKILEQNSDRLKINIEPSTNDICDVQDAFHFRNLKNQMYNDSFITLTFSVDGGQVFESSKDNSLWPLQFIVNEIDLEHRFKRKNMLCAVISFGKTPSMQVLFKPFIEEINRINAEGGLSFYLKNGQMKTVKIYPMIFTGDSPAKCHVLNKVQYNGYQGCPYCSHTGTIINRQIRYCKRNEGQLRTDEEARREMLDAHTLNERVNGYHGVSPLMMLPHFDVVWQVAIDKMHCVDLGVTKLLFKLFLENKYRNER